jgi:FkbM family methyltransferase
MKRQLKAAWRYLAPLAVRESVAQWRTRFRLDRNSPFRYCGYVLPYRPTSAILHTIQSGSYWEDALVRRLFLEIRRLQVEKPLILDIGANIGLIGLSILAEFPTARVIAFEPAPFQLRILKKTVKANFLQRRISLESVALSHQSGHASFAVHNGIDASGLDGFLDTGVGGPAKQIKVRVNTLDKWWSTKGKPFINVIKIDTEGSELMVLQGAEAVLRKCQPTLFLEIWPEHLKHYSITVHHIVGWLRSHNYELVTLSGQRLDTSDAERHFGVEMNFVALPAGVVK